MARIAVITKEGHADIFPSLGIGHVQGKGNIDFHVEPGETFAVERTGGELNRLTSAIPESSSDGIAHEGSVGPAQRNGLALVIGRMIDEIQQVISLEFENGSGSVDATEPDAGRTDNQVGTNREAQQRQGADTNREDSVGGGRSWPAIVPLSSYGRALARKCQGRPNELARGRGDLNRCAALPAVAASPHFFLGGFERGPALGAGKADHWRYSRIGVVRIASALLVPFL